MIAWQTNESSPNPGTYKVEFGSTTAYGSTAPTQGRVVNHYLAADPALPVPPAAPGARVDYYAVFSGLAYDTTYFYRVSGPGLATGGFTSSFHTRKRGGEFSFLVQGDEGFFPVVPGSNPPRIANFEARIVHLMWNAHNVHLAGQPDRPRADLALNTGDNVYNFGAENSYRDFWMPVWNSDVDSNDAGAPFLRSTPFYIVVGNHDIGGSGDFVNMLGSDSSPRFSGNTDGGNALAYYNNYYFPLNGPLDVDPQFVFNGDTSTSNGFFYQFLGQKFNSPSATEAFRSSTAVNSGQGIKRQIDHMSNYSFDSGNAHFLFLDANPHLFNAQVDSTANFAKPPAAFSAYPSVLSDWIIHDLDSSAQPWKIVVFHQPAFSSGNATLRNFQMRAIAKTLEDHGVNMVLNGHEHNYQRTFPLRALARVADAPTTGSSPAVAIDTHFDGLNATVPDGVLYIVEGAGGNRDFDDNLPSPRGQGAALDQDDSATGTFSFGPGLTFATGPASWLDTNLTDNEMSPVVPGAGSGPKITARFKSKLFSFAHVVVDENRLTLYQISEPLLSTSSATATNPAPFGTDVNGKPVNDPIPDTLIDPATGNVVSAPADGPSMLLDKFSVTKPELEDDEFTAELSAPRVVSSGGSFIYTLAIRNRSGIALNAVQAVFALPDGASFAGTESSTTTLNGNQVVVSIGRMSPGDSQTVSIPALLGNLHPGNHLLASAIVRSSTALPVRSNTVQINVRSSEDKGR